MGIDLFGQFQKGGWAMWPLLGFSVLAATFAIERLIVLFFQKRKLKPDTFLEAFEQSMKKHNGQKDAVIEEMLALCKKKGGVTAEIMQEGLTKFKQAQTLNMSAFDMKQWLNDAIEERARIELPQLEAHLGVLSTVATVAPLLGLLGTVLGMIKSFTVMANAAGGAKPNELAGGISEALITTATGMIIAIPVLIAYNFIKGTVENYVLLVEEAAIHLVDTLVVDNAQQNQ
jgi:biopolymer transport protein ExbB